MNVFFKRITFLIVLSFMVIACGGDEGTSVESCKLDTDCSNNEECRFDEKTSIKGECITRIKCQNDNECGDRDCNITLEGEDKYCGGYLINFNFKSATTLKSGRVNDDYNEIIELEGQTGAFFIAIEGNLPSGLLLNSETGDITGKPTVEGDFTFKLIAYNGKSNATNYYNIIKVEKEFTIKVLEEIVCIAKTCTELGRECDEVDDGCGTSLDCGNCADGTCNASGKCEVACVPDCSGGKICGDDGCNGDTCGVCQSDETCSTDQTVCDTNACVPDCSGSKICGDDGCSGDTCGVCQSDETCSTDQTVCDTNACVSDCSGGKICGDDGCSGDTCGVCQSDETCSDDQTSCVANCTPKSCDDLSVQCGVTDDGCGGTLDCPECETNYECIENLCEATIVVNLGDIIITELMAKPNVPDGQGGTISYSKTEWIEIYNITDNNIDLTGLKIVKGSTNYSATLITTSIAAHSYYLIARQDSSISKLPVVDATAGFALTDGGATLELKLGDLILDTVTYLVAVEGESWQKDKDFLEHTYSNDPDAWCLGTTEINTTVGDMLNTDKGTPGLENLSCPAK